MQDLTTGPVTRHLLKTTSFMLVTMIFQTLYFLVDLYWVGRLGTDAVAAVGVAGNFTFIVLALTQMLGVGTTALVSHAVGRKDHDAACMMFNQAQVLAMVTGLAFLIIASIIRIPYSHSLAADETSARLAGQYLLWFIPAMALQFSMVAMGAALRAVGNFKPTMVISTVTVTINMILAPFLIFGWVTGHAFGVAGAAISSLIAIIVGVVWFASLFTPRDSYLRFMKEDWKPKLATWKRLLGIGLPSGFEFALMALYLVIVYSIARPFGAAAQAGFGIGGRVVQAGFMPVVALGFAVAPVAGQNFGARQAQRVKDTYRNGVAFGAVFMILFAIFCEIVPAQLIRVFTKDPAAIQVGVEYLRILSISYIASGVIFVNSSMFQAMGNTIPSLLASAARIIIVVIPAVILSRQPGFELHWIWWLSAASIVIQLALSSLLLRREFNRKLVFNSPQPLSAPEMAPADKPEGIAQAT
jgi:putative MATE family efflux protein